MALINQINFWKFKSYFVDNHQDFSDSENSVTMPSFKKFKLEIKKANEKLKIDTRKQSANAQNYQLQYSLKIEK